MNLGGALYSAPASGFTSLLDIHRLESPISQLLPGWPALPLLGLASALWGDDERQYENIEQAIYYATLGTTKTFGWQRATADAITAEDGE